MCEKNLIILKLPLGSSIIPESPFSFWCLVSTNPEGLGVKSATLVRSPFWQKETKIPTGGFTTRRVKWGNPGTGVKLPTSQTGHVAPPPPKSAFRCLDSPGHIEKLPIVIITMTVY